MVNAATARACNKSDIQIGRYIRGESLPAIDTVVALANAAGVSLAWLATGQGGMGDVTHEAQGIHGNDYVLVPHYEVDTSASPGGFVEYGGVVERIAFRRDWLSQRGYSPQSLAAIKIAGDSMGTHYPRWCCSAGEHGFQFASRWCLCFAPGRLPCGQTPATRYCWGWCICNRVIIPPTTNNISAPSRLPPCG